MDDCKDNCEKYSVKNISMSQCLQYHHLKRKNKHGGYRGKNCMKKFCESLIRHAMNITNF